VRRGGNAVRTDRARGAVLTRYGGGNRCDSCSGHREWGKPTEFTVTASQYGLCRQKLAPPTHGQGAEPLG